MIEFNKQSGILTQYKENPPKIITIREIQPHSAILLQSRDDPFTKFTLPKHIQLDYVNISTFLSQQP